MTMPSLDAILKTAEVPALSTDQDRGVRPADAAQSAHAAQDTAQTAQANPESNEAAQTLLCAPALGQFSALVEPGAILQGGDVLGTLHILHRRIVVRLPKAAPALRIQTADFTARRTPVSYGQPLLRCVRADLHSGDDNASQRSSHAEDLGLPPAAIAIVAPIEGQFYRAPSPEDPPFVQEGDTVRVGQTVGLVEVMKFFYEVSFESPDAKPGVDYKVVKILAEDTTPVTGGAPLAYVVPC